MDATTVTEVAANADQICMAGTAVIAGYVSMAVTGASMLANVLPNPDDTTNPVAKFLSRVVNYFALNISVKTTKD